MEAYFDMFSGISGNMVLGALFDLGLKQEEFEEELNKLGLSDEYNIEIKQVKKEGIGGTYVNVELLKNQAQHHLEDGHHHHHHGRNLSEIEGIIDNSTLTEGVKEKCKSIFNKLAEAEAGIHGVGIDEIHFHEVGAVDAIVDIVGSVIGLDLLGIKKIYGSKINTGQGFVKCAHGLMPVPAPATMELLTGVPVFSTGIENELVTPTGAAIITTLAEEFGVRPEMTIINTGYGAGYYDLSIPNLLRISLGKTSKKKKQIKIVETNIDDMNPEIYEYIMEKLFSAGALDVYYTPVQMKKNRPGIKLNVLLTADILNEVLNILFTESSTLGIRVINEVSRYSLDREVIKVKTPWGLIRVKVAYLNDNRVNLSPEYDDCYNIARKKNIPLKKVYDTVKTEYFRQDKA